MNKYLVYVKPLYKEEELFVYSLLFSETPDIVWGPDWDISSPISNPDNTPDSSTYTDVYIIKSPFELKTLQETTCYSMEYAIYGILALSWINLENLDEYPENGRMVLHFNDSYEKVSNLLSLYKIEMKPSNLLSQH